MHPDGLTLTVSDYESKSTMPLHYHENPYFCYVLDGQYTEFSRKNNLECTKGDVIFHPRGVEHHNKFGKNMVKCFRIEFSDKWTDKLLSPALNLTMVTNSKRYDIQKLAIRVFKEFNNPDALSSLLIEGLVIELLVNTSRENNSDCTAPYYIKKVASYINEMYYTNPSLAELSGLVQISPEYLVRSFKKSFNTTIGDYIRDIRVKHACDMLKNTRKELLEIAIDTGFTDQSHFNRVFKKITGMTPLAYKKNN